MKRIIKDSKVLLALIAMTICSSALAAAPWSQTKKESANGIKPQLTAQRIVDLSKKGAIKSDQLLVKFRVSSRGASNDGAYAGLRLKRVESMRGGRNPLNDHFIELAKWQIVTFEKDQNLGYAYDKLIKHPDIEYVLPNGVYYLNAIPNDLTANQWSLQSTGQTITVPNPDPYIGSFIDYQTLPDADIDAPEAWNIRSDASNVVVAVIDTGVDYRHPDLAANMWVNRGEIPGNGIDDDGNGYIDDIYGYDFAGKDGDPMDNDGHGTHAAGRIAASGNNGQGMTGVAWKAKIMAIKVFPDRTFDRYEQYYAYTSDIVKGIVYAIDMGAKISNNGWGAFFGSHVQANSYAMPLFDVINAANHAGMLFVASTGNEGLDLEAFNSMHVPSGLTLPNIVSVGASDTWDLQLYNYGAIEVDLFAPGQIIYSTVPGGSHDFKSGTSMAASHVSGVAALMYAIRPELRPYEARAILMQTADVLPQLNGKAQSGARLNAYKALKRLTDVAVCATFTAKVSEHVVAKRAVGKTGWPGTGTSYQTVGSWESLGADASRIVTLTENTTGKWSVSNVCKQTQNMPPVVQLKGAAEVNVLIGRSYTIPGATATDRESGNLTARIVRSGSVNTAMAGTYVIKYDVSDPSGNAAVTAQRVVHVLPTDEPPYVEAFGPRCDPRQTWLCDLQKLQKGTAYVDPGYYAFDEVDGNLTSKVVRKGTPDMNKIGSSFVTYEVTDSAGQRSTSQKFRIAYVLDQNKPDIWVNFFNWERTGNDIYFAYTPDRNYLYQPSFIALDLKDEGPLATTVVVKDRQGNLVPGNIIYFDSVQDYRVEISATDSDGYTDFKVQNVHVLVDTTPPVITLIGPAYVEVAYGASWSDPWATIKDNTEGDLSLVGLLYDSNGNQVDFDSTKPGTYKRRFTGSDAAGNQAIPVTRTIVVKP